jgi:hypothetical protein
MISAHDTTIRLEVRSRTLDAQVKKMVDRDGMNHDAIYTDSTNLDEHVATTHNPPDDPAQYFFYVRRRLCRPLTVSKSKDFGVWMRSSYFISLPTPISTRGFWIFVRTRTFRVWTELEPGCN